MTSRPSEQICPQPPPLDRRGGLVVLRTTLSGTRLDPYVSGRHTDRAVHPGRPGADRPAESWPGSAQSLTPREVEILGLICRGLNNREVAQTLFLSINTVKTYIRGCYRKIGAQSRSQAVIWGLDHGMGAHQR